MHNYLKSIFLVLFLIKNAFFIKKRMFLQVVRSKIAEPVVDGKLSSRNEVDDWSVLGV